jgi:hypothetical protein
MSKSDFKIYSDAIEELDGGFDYHRAGLRAF